MKKIKVGIVGCGAIGSELAAFIRTHARYTLAGVCDVDTAKVASLRKKMKGKLPSYPIDGLFAKCDLVIEAASIECARMLIQKAARLHIPLLIVSVGTFVAYPFLRRRIKGNMVVYVPSGAISGIDGIASLSMGKIRSLTLTTSKPPSSLTGIPFLERRGVDVRRIQKETILFKGGIKEAIACFPKNVNVAATLFLASGFPRIQVTIKVNPALSRNTHRIEVESAQGDLIVEIANAPSRSNPKTSALTMLSVKRLLAKMCANLQIGS